MTLIRQKLTLNTFSRLANGTGGYQNTFAPILGGGGGGDGGALAQAIYRELLPLILLTRNSVNTTHGDVVTCDADYQVQNTDRTIICQNTAAAVVTLPPVADVFEQRFLVCRQDAVVTVSPQSGEWLYDAIDGFIILGSIDYTTELYSDGQRYWRVGGYP